MGRKIMDAILEDGQITQVDGILPQGKLKVHLVYDTEDEPVDGREVIKMLRETVGIYKEIDAREEARKLRDSWERVHNK